MLGFALQLIFLTSTLTTDSTPSILGCIAALKFLSVTRDPVLQFPPLAEAFVESESRIRGLAVHKNEPILDFVPRLGFSRKDFQQVAEVIDFSKPRFSIVGGRTVSSDGIWLKITAYDSKKGPGEFRLSSDLEPQIDLQGVGVVPPPLGDRDAERYRAEGFLNRYDLLERQAAWMSYHEWVHAQDSFTSPWGIFLLHQEVQYQQAIQDQDHGSINFLESTIHNPETTSAHFLMELRARAHAPIYGTTQNKIKLSEAWRKLSDSALSGTRDFTHEIQRSQTTFEEVVNQRTATKYPLGTPEHIERWLRRLHNP